MDVSISELHSVLLFVKSYHWRGVEFSLNLASKTMVSGNLVPTFSSYRHNGSEHDVGETPDVHRWSFTLDSGVLWPLGFCVSSPRLLLPLGAMKIIWDIVLHLLPKQSRSDGVDRNFRCMLIGHRFRRPISSFKQIYEQKTYLNIKSDLRDVMLRYNTGMRRGRVKRLRGRCKR